MDNFHTTQPIDTPFIVNPEGTLARSRNTDVYRAVYSEKDTGPNYVVKVANPIIERFPHETDRDYYARRLNKIGDDVYRQRQYAEDVRLFINQFAPAIDTPIEEFFIFNGNDGLPTFARVQPEVSGQTLKNYMAKSQLSPTQINDLRSLLIADRFYFAKSGTHLDLGGTTSEGNKYGSKLSKFFRGMLRNSVNILVKSDGSFAYVDQMPLLHNDIARDLVLSMDRLKLEKWLRQNQID